MFSCRSPPLSTVSSFIFKRPFISVFFSVLLSFGFPFLFNVLPCSLFIARSLSLSFPSSPSSAIHSSSSFSCFLLLAPLLYPLISHRGLPLVLHLILLFRPIVLVLSLLFMIVLLLFPNPSYVSLLSLSSTFILPIFLNIVLSLCSHFFLFPFISFILSFFCSISPSAFISFFFSSTLSLSLSLSLSLYFFFVSMRSFL